MEGDGRDMWNGDFLDELSGAGSWMEERQDLQAYRTPTPSLTVSPAPFLQPRQAYGDTSQRPIIHPSPLPPMPAQQNYMPGYEPVPPQTYAQAVSAPFQRQNFVYDQMQNAPIQATPHKPRLVRGEQRRRQPRPPAHGFPVSGTRPQYPAEPSRPSYAQVVSHGTTRPISGPRLDLLQPHLNIPDSISGNDVGNEYFDFDLYDSRGIDMMEDVAEPYVAGLAVNTQPAAVPRQNHLMSPTESIDTSSIASSARSRRSKREIMSGDGPFKCSQCPAGFHTNGDRAKHELRVHTPREERKYPCAHCPQRFVFNKDKLRHEREKHGDRATNARFWCNVSDCEYAIKGFVRKDHYKRHVATHYKDSGIGTSRSPSTRTYSQT